MNTFPVRGPTDPANTLEDAAEQELYISDLHMAPEDWRSLLGLIRRRERRLVPVSRKNGISVLVVPRHERRRMINHQIYECLSFAFWRTMMYAEKMGFERVHFGRGNPCHAEIPMAIGRPFPQFDRELR